MAGGPCWPVTAEEAALYVRQYLSRPCTPGTIRTWAHRNPGAIGDHGRRGRARIYALEEIHSFVTGVSPAPGA